MIEPYYMTIKEVGEITLVQAAHLVQMHSIKSTDNKRQIKRAMDNMLRANKKGLQKVINIADLIVK